MDITTNVKETKKQELVYLLDGWKSMHISCMEYGVIEGTAVSPFGGGCNSTVIYPNETNVKLAGIWTGRTVGWSPMIAQENTSVSIQLPIRKPAFHSAFKQMSDLYNIAAIVFKNSRNLQPGEEAPIEAYYAKKCKKILRSER